MGVGQTVREGDRVLDRLMGALALMWHHRIAPTISVTAGCQPANASSASLTAHSSIHVALVHSRTRTTARKLTVLPPSIA
jgi:hypothetical protein